MPDSEATHPVLQTGRPADDALHISSLANHLQLINSAPMIMLTALVFHGPDDETARVSETGR